MRVHSHYSQLQLWRDGGRCSAYVRADRLLHARLEPVMINTQPQSVLDLVFEGQPAYVVVPSIIVGSGQLVTRDLDVLIWPDAVARYLDDDNAYAIEQRLYPWLKSLALARPLNTERAKLFGAAHHGDTIRAARELGFVGAARIADAARALSPYVFAARYAIGNDVLVRGAPDGVQGAVFLAGSARSVRSEDLDPRSLEVGAAWFEPLPSNEAAGKPALLLRGPTFAAQAHGAAVEIRVDDGSGNRTVQIPRAYPMDYLFTYGTTFGELERTLSVEAHVTPPPERATKMPAHVSVGGSGGRILFALRKGAADDSDVESARALAVLLRGEGLTVDLTDDIDEYDIGSYDIVHCFNLAEPDQVIAFANRARSRGVRTVLTAAFADLVRERTWGMETATMCFRGPEMDEQTHSRLLHFFERRALLGPGWDEGINRGPGGNYAVRVAAALSLCDLVIAETGAEADAIRSIYGFEGDLRVIAPFLPAEGPTPDLPPVTIAGFALIHAPLHRQANQLLAVRAAREAGMPLVVAGPVRDFEYATRFREMSGAAVIHLDPDAGQTQWLYETAEVILDPSWYAFGTGRLHRALLSGARIAASSQGWAAAIWPEVVTVDPASAASIAQGLTRGTAPPANTRHRWAQEWATESLLRNVISAYLNVPAEVPSSS